MVVATETVSVKQTGPLQWLLSYLGKFKIMLTSFYTNMLKQIHQIYNRYIKFPLSSDRNAVSWEQPLSVLTHIQQIFDFVGH